MKKCSRCKQTLPVTEYNTNTKSKDGFQNMCKPCYKVYYKAYSAARTEAKQSVVLQSKVCRDCGLERPISMFGKKSNVPDKHNIYCKPCWSIRCKIATKKMKANRG